MSRRRNGQTGFFCLLLGGIAGVIGCEPHSVAATDQVDAPASAEAVVPTATSSVEVSASPAPASSPAPPAVDAGPDASADVAPKSHTWRGIPVQTDFSNGPLYFTGAFDGSQRFGMWAETMAFARSLARTHGHPVHFTYFINTVFYDLTAPASGIDRVRNHDELLVRTALTQQAINEGHEIANHGVGHLDGSQWDEARWREEFTAFHRVSDALLFEPVRDETGRAVFPRFAPLPGAAKGTVGAACSTNADCDASSCLPVTAEVGLCVAPCNRKQPCPTGTVCGSPNFAQDTDVCLPKPSFPVEYGGEVLFDKNGNANPNAKQLRPYRIVGFRAPFLVFGDPVLKVLQERNYRYDTSLIVPMGPPMLLSFASAKSDAPKQTLEFALMKHPDALTAPMDYNYDQFGSTGDRMFADYSMSLVAAYSSGRHPWNIGHHFAQWRGGAYWRAMKQTYEFAAAGCRDESGRARCGSVRMVSFRELAGRGEW